MQSSSYYKLVFNMLTTSFVSKCRLWKACLTTIWHSFQANTCSKKSSAKLFWLYWSKSRTGCGRSYHEFWENFNLPVVRGSETQTKRKECSISCIAIADVINIMIKLKQCFFKTILYQNISYLLNCNYQLCANSSSNLAFTNTFSYVQFWLGSNYQV